MAKFERSTFLYVLAKVLHGRLFLLPRLPAVLTFCARLLPVHGTPPRWHCWGSAPAYSSRFLFSQVSAPVLLCFPTLSVQGRWNVLSSCPSLFVSPKYVPLVHRPLLCPSPSSRARGMEQHHLSLDHHLFDLTAYFLFSGFIVLHFRTEIARPFVHLSFLKQTQ